MTAVLYLVATPIGNLDDITLRALEILKGVDLILAEDTRKTAHLLQHFGITTPVRSFFEHNETNRLQAVVEELRQGKNIALVSEAGTPTISDPGFRLVRLCRQEGIELTSLPGASSVINALALSSAPRERFMFLGFFPRKHGERKKALALAEAAGMSAVFLESPHRLQSALADIKEFSDTCRLTIAREMSKKFEDIREFSIIEALEYFGRNPPRGEFTVVIHRKERGDHA